MRMIYQCFFAFPPHKKYQKRIEKDFLLLEETYLFILKQNKVYFDLDKTNCTPPFSHLKL